MKSPVFIFVLACQVFVVKGQQVDAGFPFLGRAAELFKDSLICKDAHLFDKPYSKELKCMSYLVTPSARIYSYGSIAFNDVLVFPDSAGVIRSISHYRSYLKDSVSSSQWDDVRALRAHFNRLFNMESRLTREKSAYDKSEISIWKKERFKVVLQWTSIKKRKNVRLDAILSLYIEEEKV